MTKKILYFDMDGVLVDFQSGVDKLDEETKKKFKNNLDDVPGIFSLMEPVRGSKEAVEKLCDHFQCYILSTAPWENVTAASDKHNWVRKHYPDTFKKKVILTHRKHLCMGDFLIDDRLKNGVTEFKGEHIHFGTEKFPDWESVVAYLLKRK